MSTYEALKAKHQLLDERANALRVWITNTQAGRRKIGLNSHGKIIIRPDEADYRPYIVMGNRDDNSALGSISFENEIYNGNSDGFEEIKQVVMDALVEYQKTLEYRVGLLKEKLDAVETLLNND